MLLATSRAVSCIRAMVAARFPRLRWTFSSLGCPECDLDGMFATAKRYGLESVELRAVEGSIDVPGWLRRRFESPEAFAAHVAGAGVRIASLDTSLRMIDGDAAAREKLLEFLPWAEALGGVPLRVFDGGSTWGTESRVAAAAAMAWWDERRTGEGWRSEWIVETHDCLFDADSIAACMADAPKSVRILWDTHHTWKRGGENPTATWARIRKWVRHVHVKDSVSRPSGRHPFSYVFLGDGEFPLQETLSVLERDGYASPVSLEWERMWHPELPSLEAALERGRQDGWV
jgi:sugar phosphate isomerase/epimerase